MRSRVRPRIFPHCFACTVFFPEQYVPELEQVCFGQKCSIDCQDYLSVALKYNR